MTLHDDINGEATAYQKGPFEDLTIQVAMTIIAVCAAQMDPQDCQEDISRVAAIVESRPEFDDKSADVFSRINMYVNSMQVVDSQQAVKIAADVLKNPEAKRSAFEIAVEVAVPDRVLTEEKKVILENIAAKLYINREFMQQAMEKFAS